jgi:hypothetical protein
LVLNFLQIFEVFLARLTPSSEKRENQRFGSFLLEAFLQGNFFTIQRPSGKLRDPLPQLELSESNREKGKGKYYKPGNAKGDFDIPHKNTGKKRVIPGRGCP